MFNAIIKKLIEDLILKLGPVKEDFEVAFEKKSKEYHTTEIPDWYILEKSTNKIIIGMNQLDLWRGGQQINRGSKYLENNKHNSEKSKLLCVVCNMIQFTSEKNKAYNLFKCGFENNTLCYLNNLENIIMSYFNIPIVD
jgi:predicted glycosyltransferase